MEPLLTMCMASWSAKYEDFLFQMQNSAYFVEVLCKNHFLGKCQDRCFMDCVYFIHVHVIIGYLDVCMIFFQIEWDTHSFYANYGHGHLFL